MTMRRKTGLLLAATAVASLTVSAAPAVAQDAATLRSIQSQIADLQAQLRRLQKQAAERDAALRRAQDDAAQARLEAHQATTARLPAPLPVATVAAIKPNEEAVVLVHPPLPDGSPDLSKPTGKFRVGGMTITLGGFIDADGIYRSKNLASGTGSPFNRIPLPNDPNAHVDELRGTAQQTRLSIALDSNISKVEKLRAFVEFDFNGAATTSNSVQTNSYTPRLRQAFVEYDNSNLGFHVLGGQAWSLATGDVEAAARTNDWAARNELIPLTIDTNYLPGFVYTRNPQVRVVEDFGAARNYHLAFSVEAPQSTFAVSPTTASGGVLPPVARLPATASDSVFYSTLGGSNLNSTATYSNDAGPDLIVKGSADPGWGHYELFGLGRFARSLSGVKVGLATNTSNKTTFGGGVGGAFTVPLLRNPGDAAHNYLELTGDVLGGYGVGRYGAAALPDGTFQGNGEPALLPEIMGYVGLVSHPNKAFDLYSYLGTDQVGRSLYTSGVGGRAVQVGYGGTTVDTSGCYTEGATTCSAQTHSLWNVSLGTWWKFLKGPYGTVQAGLEYSFTRRDAFRGSAGAGVSSTPHTTENVVFATIRYSPFN